VERKLALPNVERRLFVGKNRRVMVPGGKERGSLVSQAGLLQLLHELCGRHPHYQLDFGTTALQTIRENGRVVALKTRREGTEGRVEGDLFVDCSGRNSGLRRDVGLQVQTTQVPADVVWLRFDLSDAPEALPESVDVHMFGKGVVVVFVPTTRSRLQVAYSAPGDLGGLRQDLPELRRRLLPTVPERLRPHIEAKLDERVFQKIEDERRPETDMIQGMQTRVHRMVMAPMFVEHIMFTLLGLALRLMKKADQSSQGVTQVEMRYGVPVSQLP
jgi:hypothetical protein